MQARLTTKPRRDVIAAIQALDLESVKERVMDAELGKGWTRDYADSIEGAYKNYLTMLVKYPDDAGDILLSKDVDEFWHTHILQTMKYAEDCQRVFGNFLHHSPHTGERTAASAERRAASSEKTRRLYLREFGNAQAADAAWSGKVVGTAANAAYCEATAAPKVAYCEATVRTAIAAYCEANAHAAAAAYCEAGVRKTDAAYCEANVGRVDAAYCEANAHAAGAAYCEATVRASDVAYCEAAVRNADAAYCEATAGTGDAPYCEAGVQTVGGSRIAARRRVSSSGPAPNPGQ